MGQKKKKKKKMLAKERQPTTVERFLLEIEQKGIFIFVCKGGLNCNEEDLVSCSKDPGRAWELARPS
jgi:predicted peroxiredoxin